MVFTSTDDSSFDLLTIVGCWLLLQQSKITGCGCASFGSLPNEKKLLF